MRLPPEYKFRLPFSDIVMNFYIYYGMLTMCCAFLFVSRGVLSHLSLGEESQNAPSTMACRDIVSIE